MRDNPTVESVSPDLAAFLEWAADDPNERCTEAGMAQWQAERERMIRRAVEIAAQVPPCPRCAPYGWDGWMQTLGGYWINCPSCNADWRKGSEDWIDCAVCDGWADCSDCAACDGSGLVLAASSAPVRAVAP